MTSGYKKAVKVPPGPGDAKYFAAKRRQEDWSPVTVRDVRKMLRGLPLDTELEARRVDVLGDVAPAEEAWWKFVIYPMSK